METKILPRKLFSIDEACERRIFLRKKNKKVVLTNGCFDILHAGHVMSLEQAKEFGDSLWVAINSDNSVKKIKGDHRPIFDVPARAYVLSALESVDGIFIFDRARLTDEILKFRPDIYVKSGDYDLTNLNSEEMNALRSIGAEIKFVHFLDGFSTTSIIEKIKKS